MTTTFYLSYDITYIYINYMNKNINVCRGQKGLFIEHSCLK